MNAADSELARLEPGVLELDLVSYNFSVANTYYDYDRAGRR